MSKAEHYKGWADIVSEKEKTKEKTKEKSRPVGLLEQGWVRVADVLVLPSHVNLDDELVSFIAESFPVCGGGPFNPIIVRRVHQQEDCGDITKTVLVAGAQRLQAARLMGMEYINCVFIQGDETAARIVQIAEDLFRKDMTVLKHAEMLAEWLSLALVNFSGQVVQNGKGRSLSGIARAARVWPAVGRSVEARRKILERAIRIARLAREIKKAAIMAGLDDNQRALIKIADAKGRKAQLKKVEDLAGRMLKSNALPKLTGNASASSHAGLQRKTSSAVQSPPLQSGTGGAIGSSKSVASNTTTATPLKRETTFDELEAFWDRDGRELWAYAPFGERERFIEKLRRAKCKAQVDVVAFLKDVFRGRFEVKKRDLYALAKARGLAKGSVQKALSDLTYPAKRKGQRSLAVWYFRNKDRDWKDEVRTVTDAELAAAHVAHPDRTIIQKPKGAKARHEYYAGL